MLPPSNYKRTMLVLIISNFLAFKIKQKSNKTAKCCLSLNKTTISLNKHWISYKMYEVLHYKLHYNPLYDSRDWLIGTTMNWSKK